MRHIWTYFCSCCWVHFLAIKSLSTINNTLAGHPWVRCGPFKHVNHAYSCYVRMCKYLWTSPNSPKRITAETHMRLRSRVCLLCYLLNGKLSLVRHCTTNVQPYNTARVKLLFVVLWNHKGDALSASLSAIRAPRSRHLCWTWACWAAAWSTKRSSWRGKSTNWRSSRWAGRPSCWRCRARSRQSSGSG